MLGPRSHPKMEKFAAIGTRIIWIENKWTYSVKQRASGKIKRKRVTGKQIETGAHCSFGEILTITRPISITRRKVWGDGEKISVR